MKKGLFLAVFILIILYIKNKKFNDMDHFYYFDEEDMI